MAVGQSGRGEGAEMIGIVLATLLSLGELSGDVQPCKRNTMVTIYKVGTAELAPLYIDILGTPQANPFMTKWRECKFVVFVEDGNYDVVFFNHENRIEFEDQVPMLGGLTLREFWRRYRRFGARLK